jgi:hypothetical protein
VYASIVNRALCLTTADTVISYVLTLATGSLHWPVIDVGEYRAKLLALLCISCMNAGCEVIDCCAVHSQIYVTSVDCFVESAG